VKLKVSLDPVEIIANTDESGGALLELSTMESIYCIRKLKALTESLVVGEIDLEFSNQDYHKGYSEKYEIWFYTPEFKAPVLPEKK